MGALISRLEFHKKEYEIAFNANKNKAAEHHHLECERLKRLIYEATKQEEI